MKTLLFINFLLIVILSVSFLSCQKEFSNPDGSNTSDSTAVFSLITSANTCSNVVSAGTFKKSLALNSSNKITIDVSVAKVGTWVASTNTVNGISFSGTANFSTTGNQKITLQGVGLPTQAGANSFLLKAGRASCSFILNVDSSSATTGNIAPVANAGADTIITLPINTVALNGTGTDADGIVVSYSWKKIAGPSAFVIVSPAQPQTTVNSLVSGNYEFELTITDNLGATGKDTVAVQVLSAAASGTLSMQQDLTGVGPLNDVMHFDASGKIIMITSNHYPERIISYVNNKISIIEYWYDNGSGTLYKGQTDNFVYDATGNVSKINETDNVTNSRYVLALFTYNIDNTLSSKKTYFSSGSPLTDFSFIYTGGNLTGFIDNMSGDTALVTYDSRVNTFNTIYPQFYFLDLQTVYDQNYRSEIFYFSKNYPTAFNSTAINVATDATTQKPFEVSFDNSLWYRYVF